MPSLKEYNVKIASLKNTAKVTKTMNMVSSAKFRKAQDAQNNSRLYANQLKGVIGRLAGAAGSQTHPLMEVSEEVSKALVVVFASDKGLCGGFNNNLIKFVKKWLANDGKSFSKIDYTTTSKRATNGIKGIGNIIKRVEDKAASPDFATAKEIGELAQEKFIAGEYDEVFLVYNVFESALSQKPTMEKVLPLSAEKAEGSGQEIDYIYEPNRTELLSYLLPKSVNFAFFSAFLESAAGEHAARMAAMDSATTNAKKLIDLNTTLRNRARQAQITTELTEIVAGAESLK